MLHCNNEWIELAMASKISAASKSVKPVTKAPRAAKTEAATPATAASVAAPKAIVTPKVVVAARKANPTPKAVAPAPAQGLKIMNDTIEQVQATVKNAALEAGEKASTMLKDLSARAKEAMAKSGDFAKDAVEFNKANVEALVESGKIAAKNAQSVAEHVADLGRKNFEATTAHVKAASALKSPTELFKLQGDFARGQFESAVAEMSKSTEMYMKLAGEMFQPLQNRYAVAVEKAKAGFTAA